MDKTKDLLLMYARGDWIDNLSEAENSLLVDFLKQSLAKQSKRVAFAQPIEEGVLYAVYKIRHRKEENVLDLIVPGQVYLHKTNEEMPKEVQNIPKVSLSTIRDLGKTVE